MSTKIYNGFKITKNKTLLSLHESFNNLRAPIKEIAHKVTAEAIARYAVFFIDRSMIDTNKKQNEVDPPLMQSKSLFMQRQQQVQMQRYKDPDVDFQCEVTIHPIDDDTILGISFTERPDIRNLLLEQDFIEEFCYWDNTDILDGVSEEDWKIRGDLWEKALGNNSPAMAGYTICLSNVTGSVTTTIDDVMKNLPTFDARVELLATEEVVNFYYSAKEHAEKKEDFPPYEKWKESEAGKLVIEARTKKIEAKISKEITEEMLTARLQK